MIIMNIVIIKEIEAIYKRKKSCLQEVVRRDIVIKRWKNGDDRIRFSKYIFRRTSAKSFKKGTILLRNCTRY